MRVHAAQTYARLKAATRKLIKQAGGCEHAETRVGKSKLADYGNPNSPDSYAPVDVIIDLECEVGPVVTSELAKLQGYALVPTSPVSRAGHDCPVMAGADISAALGHYLDEAMRAVEDGTITNGELDRLIERIQAIELKASQARDALWRRKSPALRTVG